MENVDIIPEALSKKMEKYYDIWERSRAYLQKGRGIDFVHARISLDFAVRLLNSLGGDPDVVIPAVMLHDIGNAVIEDDDLQERTVINLGTDAPNKIYSTTLKEQHLREGERLSRRILQEVCYPQALLESIVEIVGDHEDVWSLPPQDKNNVNKVIVSDADKLFRYSAYGVFSICKIHKIPEKEMLRLVYKKLGEWLITERAKEIAREELRKNPNSHTLPELMAV